jgi:hypothetical protein
MPTRHTFDEDLTLRLGAVVAGGMLLIAASLAVEFARQHLMALGTLCGAGPVPHCGWCFGAAGLALAGLAAFSYALRPALRRLSPCPSPPSRS